MGFVWDTATNERDRTAGGLPFVLAIKMFDGQTIDLVDRRRDYGATRMQAVGMVGGLVLLCVYTDRGPVRRIISLRRATRRERDAYGTTFPG